MVVPVADVDVREDIPRQKLASDISAEAAEAGVVLVAASRGAGEDCQYAGGFGADAGWGAFAGGQGRQSSRRSM